MGDIVLDHQELLHRLEQDRQRGARIAFTNGAFDLIHVGHLRSLEHAATLAEKLVVAINSDRSVRASKGQGRPVIDQNERAELLAALRCVDYVTVFDHATVDRLLETLKPEIYCKGTDYLPESIPEARTVDAYGGQVVIVGDPKRHSSTNIIDRIKQLNHG